MHHLQRGESNWVKQSIPFSYLSFSAKSLDGSAHAVQVYSDITGGACNCPQKLSYLHNLVAEFASGNRGHLIKWSATNYSNIIYHGVKLQTQEVFSEINDQAEWGTLYYAMEKVSDCCMSICRINRRSVIQGNGVTYKIAAGANSRAFFVANGTLNNQVETPISVINDSFPVFAISRDLGSIQATQAPVVWTIGLTTDPAISYTDLSGASATGRSPYYKSQYSDDGSLVRVGSFKAMA